MAAQMIYFKRSEIQISSHMKLKVNMNKLMHIKVKFSIKCLYLPLFSSSLLQSLLRFITAVNLLFKQ